MIELNKIYHLDNREGLPMLPEKCANLIISDPPYFEVKGDFDFVWKSFDEYLEFMEGQAKLYKRILAENGTLFVYGHSKRIAYIQVIFDKYFDLLNNCVWEKAEADGLFGSTGSEQLRTFPNSTERVLMYTHEDESTGLQMVLNNQTLFKSIRDYFQTERLKTNLSYKEINEKCFGTASNGGGMASNILTSYKDGWTFPTKEKYEALQKIGICQRHYYDLNNEYESLRKDYETIRLQNEETRRPFNNFTKSTEVLKFRFVPSVYDHDTVKPETLTRALILTCSRPNDLVVIPFAGSGTECAMAAKEGRRFIGFDTMEKYVHMGNKRVDLIKMQPTLFGAA